MEQESREDLIVEEGQGKIYNYRHRAYYFGSEIIRFVNEERFKPVFLNLYRQLVDSGTSIGANLVEGKAGVSSKDYLNFLNIALKSSNETKFWFCQLRDTIGQDKDRIRKMIIEAD